MKIKWKIIYVMIGVAIGATAIYLINRNDIILGKRYRCLSVVENALSKEAVYLKENRINKKELINGFIKSYNDKYMEYKEMNESSYTDIISFVNRAPTALGCGFKIDYSNKGDLYFSDVEYNSYAEKYGISKGDKIISIDDEYFIDDLEFAKKLLGKEGTIFKLVIDHNGEQKIIQFTRHSKIIKNYDLNKIDERLYIRIKRFDLGIAFEIEDEISKFEFDSVILDLRDNRGGGESEALSLADIFAGDGFCTNYYYNGEIEKLYTYTENSDYNIPIVVLVNENSASSSELCTGLLKQYANATILGTTTFGKGIFQSNMMVEGGSLKYTAGYYTVGDWECYQGVGIAPDIEIEMDSELIGTDEDIQLQKAIEILS